MTSHLALYVSLFYHWNKKKVMSNMPIRWDDVMQIACIGFYNTYYRCLKDLHTWAYMLYAPWNHPNIPGRGTIPDISRIAGRIIIDTTPDTTGVPDVIPSINSLNKINSINKTKGKAPAPVKKIDDSGSTRHSRPIDLKEAADYFRDR